MALVMVRLLEVDVKQVVTLSEIFLALVVRTAGLAFRTAFLCSHAEFWWCSRISGFKSKHGFASVWICSAGAPWCKCKVLDLLSKATCFYHNKRLAPGSLATGVRGRNGDSIWQDFKFFKFQGCSRSAKVLGSCRQLFFKLTCVDVLEFRLWYTGKLWTGSEVRWRKTTKHCSYSTSSNTRSTSTCPQEKTGVNVGKVWNYICLQKRKLCWKKSTFPPLRSLRI